MSEDRWKRKQIMTRTTAGTHKRTRKGLVKALDDIIREIVRVRDDHQCQWCGKTVKGFDSQVSHIVSRKYYAVRWDLLNVILKCASCHFKWHDDPTAGAEWFKNKFRARWEYLQTAGRLRKFKDYELAELLEDLKKKLVELKTE